MRVIGRGLAGGLGQHQGVDLGGATRFRVPAEDQEAKLEVRVERNPGNGAEEGALQRPWRCGAGQ